MQRLPTPAASHTASLARAAQRALGLADAALALGLGEQWTWDCRNRYFRERLSGAWGGRGDPRRCMTLWCLQRTRSHWPGGWATQLNQPTTTTGAPTAEPDEDEDGDGESDGPQAPAGFRYDRVYASPDLRPAALRLVGAEEVTPDCGDCLSDHYGVLALLELPEPEQPAAAGAAAGAPPEALAWPAAAPEEPPLKQRRL